MATQSKIDQLTETYAAYLRANALPSGDAMELLMGAELTAEQRQWLSDFSNEWDAASEADPEFYDKQTVRALTHHVAL